ncbi:MAG: MFS transporter [Bdellovibrionales bacterium]
MTTKTKSPLFVIFLTIFIDIVGFGMIIPLNPYLAQRFGATPFEVGALMGIYSLMQFLFSPYWGRLSDRIGRRPVIILGLIGTGIAHIAFAFSTELWMLYATRAFAGLFGGNISTAMAYVADVTPSHERSKGMGLVGAAFGLGFVLGPFLGGILASVGLGLGTEPPFGESFSAVIAGVICLLNAGFAFFVLKESLPANKTLEARPSKSEMAFEYLSRPVVGPLLLASFLAVFSMAQMEPILFLYVKDVFQWDVAKASFAFAYVGVMMAFAQGYLLRKLIPIFGERKLIVAGTILTGIGLAAIGFSANMWVLAMVITIMAIGIGVRSPSLNGSVSLLCSEREQGAIMGVNQSMAAIGRILGPPLGGWMYSQFGQQVPFVVAGLTALLGLPIVLRLYDLIPDHSTSKKSVTPSSVTPTASTEKILSVEPIGLNQEVRNKVLDEVKKELAEEAEAKVAQLRAQEAVKQAIEAEKPAAEKIKPVTPPSADEPKPIVILERPRGTPSDASKHVKTRMENSINFITSFQFRNLFGSQSSFLFLDLRAPESQPQYSRTVHVTLENALEVIAKRTPDKRFPILIVCEDGTVSTQLGKTLIEQQYLNIVVLEGGTRSLNKTSLL